MQILNDFQTSVSKALGEIDPKWRDYSGLIICGTHAPHDVEYMLDCIQEARESGLPFLGICFGYQIAAIEYARTVLRIKDATSEEFEGKCKECNGSEIYEGEEHVAFGHQLYFCQNCLRDVNGHRVSRFVVKKRPEGLKVGLHEGESWWSNYEVTIQLVFPKNFFCVQYHPEYQSSKDKPHPILVSFLKYAKEYTENIP